MGFAEMIHKLELLPIDEQVAIVRLVDVLAAREQTRDNDGMTARKGALSDIRAQPIHVPGDGLPMKREELYDRGGIR